MTELPDLDPTAFGVGRAIRQARQASGISMRALAARCGVSQPFLSEVERGMSMPSIATLYRVAEALGVTPSSLLPAYGPDDIHLIGADEGQRAASSERPNSAIGRVVYADEAKDLEVYEYVTDATEDLDVWYEHEGDKVLHLIEGRLTVEFEGRPPVSLVAGDFLVHTGRIAHRWSIEHEGTVRLVLVIVNQRRR